MSLTLILVIVTGLISYSAFNNRSLFDKLLFRPTSINMLNEYYRFITHGFVHADMNHLLINLFVLYQFGEYIEQTFNIAFGEVLGRVLFLVLYLGAVIASSIPSYFKHKENAYYSAVGASGGTSAVVFAYVLFNPWSWFLFPPLPAILFGVGYLFYSSYMGKKGTDNIGHDAHFWGAVFGFGVTIASILSLRSDLIENIASGFLAGPTMPPFF